MYQSELDEINNFITTKERIIEMVFGIYHNVEASFDIRKTFFWSKRKLKLLELNPDVKSRPIISTISCMKEYQEENNDDV